MKRVLITAVVATLGTQFSAFAQEPGLYVYLKLSKDGQQVAAPKLWSQFGVESSIQAGNSFRLELTGADLGTKTDIRFKVFTERAGKLELTAQPRLHADYDAESSFSFKGDDGAVYSVSLLPGKRVRPL